MRVECPRAVVDGFRLGVCVCTTTAPLSILSGRVIEGLDGCLDGFADADGVQSAAVDDRRDVVGVVGA